MWKKENNQLKCSFQFDDFAGAVDFMSKVAFTAKRIGHHQSWSHAYNKVDISLFAYDADSGIAEMARKLALAIDEIFKTQATILLRENSFTSALPVAGK
jgi:4a-hydroxytetrahydrobiopterin dehydratase